MHIFSSRLSEVREELGLSQKAMAEKCGVSLRSQQNYEAGERAPDADYLSAVAVAGGDVLYILTGQRSQPVSATASLPPRVRALVDNYENAPEAGKKVIEQTASFAAQPRAARSGE